MDSIGLVFLICFIVSGVIYQKYIFYKWTREMGDETEQKKPVEQKRPLNATTVNGIGRQPYKY